MHSIDGRTVPTIYIAFFASSHASNEFNASISQQLEWGPPCLLLVWLVRYSLFFLLGAVSLKKGFLTNLLAKFCSILSSS